MTVTIKISEESRNISLERGESLLDAINRAAVDGFDAPCGGKGTCGKCKVVVKNPSAPDDVERKFLSDTEIEKGIRLACRIFPDADMEILIDSAERKALIQSSFAGEISKSIISDQSICRKIYLELLPPTIEDQRSDSKRILDALNTEKASKEYGLPLTILQRLPEVLYENDYKFTLTSFFDQIVNIQGGNPGQSFAVAVDIGTTTVVAYLVNMTGADRGTIIDLVSALNSQKGYGGDVISRIEYCIKKEGNLHELHKRINLQISAMVVELAGRNNISIDLIDLICIAGNTTMTHLFAGFNPAGIATAPFIPVDTKVCAASAADFGLELSEGCSCIVLPGIASYVGSDITSGIVATGMYESEELCLLIDVGTNGEIVLGSKNGISACSTAAGPALEGANISCGMGGVQGAVNSLTVGNPGDKEFFNLNVIGNTEPAGICGSGIVDAVALFVEAGIIDETGRMLSVSELADAGVDKSWTNCVIETDGSIAVQIADNIIITQKDIREIQMAKAAIAAGVKTLLSETGKTTADVKKLYIAGGFGAAMNKHSAAVIGLIPADLEDVVVAAGNTAGKGAVLAALSNKILNDMDRIAENVNYIELSTSALFQQQYMMAMYF